MKGEQLPAHGSVWKAELDVSLDATKQGSPSQPSPLDVQGQLDTAPEKQLPIRQKFFCQKEGRPAKVLKPHSCLTALSAPLSSSVCLFVSRVRRE
jgi:hypothetical protein